MIKIINHLIVAIFCY